jgi:NAD-dependent deacetylase
VIVNAGETPYDHLAEEVLRHPIGEVLPRLVGGVRRRAAGG